MLIEQEALNFVRSLQNLYLERRDVDSFLSVFDEHSSWIGMGGRESVRDFRDAAREFLQKQGTFQGRFTVTDSWYKTAPVSPAVCVVYGEYCAHAADAAVVHHRVSAVCVKKAEGMKLLHLHLSKSDDDQEKGGVCAGERTGADNQIPCSQAGQPQGDLHESGRGLEVWTENVPGGVHQCADDSCFTLLNMSASFLLMFGYSREEIDSLFSRRYLNMIHPDDRRAVLKSKSKQLLQGSSLEFEYRVICKDGTVLWILDRGALVVREDGLRTYFCLLMDITQQRKEREALRLSLERYKVIMNQTTDIIFEWDIQEDTIIYSSNWRKKFGYLPVRKQISRRLQKSDHIHPDDVYAFLKIMKDTAAGVPYSETEFRIRNAAGQYTWCGIRATTQFDRARHPIKAVGIITDINEEKKQKQHLMDQAQRDTLTGLFNKGTTKAKIEEILGRGNGAGLHALMIIDVDNFKTVNDRFGHQCGDAVLSELSGGLKKPLRSSDIIGRIGGDEFLVFLPDISGRDTAEIRAREVLQVFRDMPSEIGAVISGSVGIALYPQDAKDYSGLFQRADSALYQVKNDGKNGYAFYEEYAHDSVPYALSRTAVNEKIDSEEHIELDEELVQYVFRMLYNAMDIKTAVKHILKIVGQAYNVSRVYIFESSEDALFCNNTFEWCGEGVSAEIDKLQNISYEKDLGGYLANFDEKGVFYCPDIRTLHPDLFAILAPQGIASILQCAIRDDGCFKGYVGFDECRRNRYWTKEQINSLTLIANILSTFLLKERAKERISLLKACVPAAEIGE